MRESSPILRHGANANLKNKRSPSHFPSLGRSRRKLSHYAEAQRKMTEANSVIYTDSVNQTPGFPGIISGWHVFYWFIQLVCPHCF